MKLQRNNTFSLDSNWLNYFDMFSLKMLITHKLWQWWEIKWPKNSLYVKKTFCKLPTHGELAPEQFTTVPEEATNWILFHHVRLKQDFLNGIYASEVQEKFSLLNVACKKSLRTPNMFLVIVIVVHPFSMRIYLSYSPHEEKLRLWY